MSMAVSFVFLMSCQWNSSDSNNGTASDAEVVNDKEEMAIFPITDYLEGQVKIIKELPVTLLKIENHDRQTDSGWVSRESVEQLATPFLQPVIDSAFLTANFSGSSFLDQTINAVTFTYSARKEAISEGVPIETISVYVDPVSHEVERLYIEKLAGDTSVQLTWKSGKWFSIRKIIDDRVSEEKIVWDFN